MDHEEKNGPMQSSSGGGGGCPFKHGSGGVRLSESPAVAAPAAPAKDEKSLTDAIIEAAFDAMFLSDEKGIIQYVNETAVLATGYTREELIGQNVSLVIGGRHAAPHDFYMQRYLRTGESAIIGKTREGQDLLYKRKDGTEHPAELGLAEIRTGTGQVRQFVGFARDISQRKKDEAELKRRQVLSEAIIEASTDAMFIVDRRGVITMTNSAATEQFGYTREEFLGMCVSRIGGGRHNRNNNVTTDDDKDDDDGYDFLRRYLNDDASKNERVEFQAVRSDGTKFPAQLGFRAVETQSSADREHGRERDQDKHQKEQDRKDQLYCGFVHDLTEHKRILEMQVEQTKADALLFNMLPHAIADRLKGNPEYIADQHATVSILFADIVGFTAMSSQMSPVMLVAMLNELFSEFDNLVETYDMNKVKTIGDCYMVTSRPDIEGYDKQRAECSEMCHFGMDMLAALRAFNRKHPENPLDLRVGINTGPVVAGIVGTKRFLYDIWGDAVNIASRMESTGIPGKIQVSKDVVEFVGEEFVFERRGLVHCKGKGDIETFFLERRLGEATVTNVVGRRRSSVMSGGIEDELMKLAGDDNAGGDPSGAVARRRSSRSLFGDDSGCSDVSGMQTSLSMLMSAKDFLEQRIEAVESTLKNELESSKNSFLASDLDDEIDADEKEATHVGVVHEVPIKADGGDAS